MICVFFFFSSRRRHTRCLSDWSSDVCSSDLRKAKSEPESAAAALALAKVFREALFALVTQIVSGSAPPKAALALLREHWIAGINAHELRFDDGHVVAELCNDAADFDLIASMIAYRMVEHVLPLPKDRLRICQGPNCSWLFIDSSKADRRRWCDMAVCGNAAKSRRFYARSRQRLGPGSPACSHDRGDRA